MKKFLLFFAAPALLFGALFLLASNSFSPLPVNVPDETADPTFVGSQACASCHQSEYDIWIESGHPYKFTVIEGGNAPVYPIEADNFQDQYMTNLGDGSHTWDNIAGVIGGYGWKARFVGTDGHLVGTLNSGFSTGGGHNQFNFFGGENHGWVDYHPGDEKIYNYGCFKCHTTGGTETGTWLAGVDGLGDFTEGGVGCEGCHGPGSNHINTMSTDDIDRVYEFAHTDNALGGLEINGVVQMPDPNGDDINFLCGTCHNRDYKDPINAKGGFVKHHEQWDEFMATAHGEGSMTCNTCHDPHKRVIWDGDGIVKTCTECHADKATTLNHSAGATCIDCHMPYAAKSGTTRGASGFKGDVRSHLFKITPDTESMFTEDGAWVLDDDTRSASLSPAYSCLGCHNDDPGDAIPDKTLEEAANSAKRMHTPDYVAPVNDLKISIYPNPSSGETRINVNLPVDSKLDMSIINSSGQIIYSELGRPYSQGSQVIHWDGKNSSGEDVQSGYYFVKISAGSYVSIDKLLMMR